MKNTTTDYFTQLRNDFTPKKKVQYGHSRRPFNPGNPNELSDIPASQSLPGAASTNSTFAVTGLAVTTLSESLAKS